ncbi:MAG: Hpt domain-containing protein [Dehalococcoidia bacterium]
MKQQGEAKQGEKIIVQVDAEIEGLVPAFFEARYEDIKSLLEALEQADYETIRDVGHTLKGAGGSYGFDAVTDIGSSLEQAAKEKRAEEIRRRVAELSTYLDSVEVAYE